MLRKGLVFAALCLMPAMASAQIRGPWELELSGSGANGSKFNGFTAALNGNIGYFIVQDQLEIQGRQTLTYTDVGVPSSLDASTRVAVDWHFPLGDQNQILPFVGANLGYVYGNGIVNTFEAAPEGGVKLFLSNDWFVFGQVEYQFFFRSSHGAASNFKNGQFVYTLGVGVRF